MNVYGDNQPVNDDEVAKIAVDLYHKHEEENEVESSVKGALQEFDIPDVYYEAAKAEIYRRKMAALHEENVRQFKRRFRTRLLIAIAICLSPFLYPIVRDALHKPAPFTLGFANVSSDWFLEESDGTVGRMDPITVNNEAGMRISVDHFAPSVSSAYPGGYWVQANANTGPFDMRKLSRVTFMARGHGLDRVRLRFNSGDEDWVSPVLVVDENWRPITVNLNDLYHNRADGSSYVFEGEGRVDDTISSVSVQVGQYVNPISAKGFVDVEKLEFR